MARALAFGLALVAVVSTFGQPSSTKEPARKPGPAQSASSQAGADLSPSQIFSRARPSVVVIVAGDENSQREALGSGFIVGHDMIATNHHVVEGMNEAFVVFSDGDVKPVSRVVADSTQQDLIVLTVETDARPTLVFGDELSLRQGDTVYALGAPKGLELTFTNGIVSAFRKSNGQFLIQTTAPIAPGSSGGPLFDRTGSVIGVTTSLLADAPGIYFSVGIGDLRRLLRTPQGVALPFEEWANQHANQSPSASFDMGAPNQGPSLQETISWMQKFYGAHGSGAVFFSTDPFHQKASAPGCAVYLAVQYMAGKTWVVEYFDLSDIDPDSVKVKSRLPLVDGDAVAFETSDGSLKIHHITTSDPTMTPKKLLSSDQARSVQMPGGTIILDSSESNQRFANALKHAVTICGGTGSPF